MPANIANLLGHRRGIRRLLGVGVAAAVVLGLVTAPAAAAATGPDPSLTAATSTAPTTTSPAAPFDSRPAADAVNRLIGRHRASQVSLRAVAKGAGPDHFRVYADQGRLVIEGTSPAVQLTGFGYYLRTVAHADVSINGSQLDLPQQLPLPGSPIEKNSSVDNRFALNDTNEGYAGPYLSWDSWQHRIDVLALHGINEVLVYEGQDAVYQQTFQHFGYSAQDMRNWIPQPGHQAWWLLQNMCCTDGPISQQLIDQRIQLGRQITDRLRSLGMTPVLPGYFGTVPTDFEVRNPGAHTVVQGTWNQLERPDWLDPTDPLFAQVAATFYREQTELFGPSTMYKMDLLHEGGKAGDVDVPDASRAVQRALETAHPGAIWTILGWQKNPLPATLQAIDRSKMFIVDGITEQPNITDRDADFFGTPWAFGTIWNFGGHVNIGAGLTVWNEKFHAMLSKPGTAMNGIALMPEAIDNNPAAVAFFTDLPWEDAPVDLHNWFDDYATARYGAVDPHASAAWRTIADTAYSWPAGKDTRHVTGLFDDQPGLGNTGTPLQYDIPTFDSALGELLQVAPRLRHSDAYRYDLVDVARQVLANHSRLLLPKIKQAADNRDLTAFRRLTGQWMDQLHLMDRLLGTDSNFLLGSWQQEAARQAATPAENATLQYNLKSLVTLWSADSDLQDYARREWNGLVGDYYGSRWQQYFDSISTSIRTGKAPAVIDWKAVAENWAHADTRFPSHPRGSAYALATEIAGIPAGELTVAAGQRGISPGQSATVTTTFTNKNVNEPSGRARVKLQAPAGYRVTSTGSTAGRVPAAGTLVTEWTVSPPADAPAGAIAAITATADWSSGRRTDTATAATSLLIGGPVGAPYETIASTDAVFAQPAGGIAIAAGGDDLWKQTNEFAAAYRTDALTDGQAVATTVTQQDGPSPYTRSGLIVSNDLSVDRSGGYANLAITPGHGCMLSWDSDGDGRLDTYRETGGFAPVVQLRLRKDDDRLIGSCSSDGKNWSVVGTATLTDAAATLDVGLFVTAVDRYYGQQAIASFTDLTPAADTPRDGSADQLQSVGKPVTALDAEAGHPATAANDGKRTNSPYWGGPLSLGSTWWQVDLGAVNDVSRINVRNYVDGTRSYTYRLEGSLDGSTFYTLGGKSNANAATDAGDTAVTEARARYVRVVGFSNTANPTFHLTEVSVYGTPVG
ncbi:alpha-N-acetylglucosaminidase TIM-barrel domain-containing protein [Nakamurella lactea]|uniref:alpha-N-acetylglucosaminidase TIM-barrel domain-containing protein n=1 Tax=Nakamurella lactea TaxID=459515 RepID=UPI000422EBEC|nr:alpha-N-acetylglucosaminidase TIM-barrel domain-containing protein [Nakamurella lactea]